MAFPVPPDARENDDFEIVKGLDEMIRTDLTLATGTTSILKGEWVKPTVAGSEIKMAKLVTGVDTGAAPAMGAKVAWTSFISGDFAAGQTDSQATGKVTVVSGSYQAKTAFYDPTDVTVFAPGNLLVAVYYADDDAGVLLGLAPGAATTRQLQAVVGRSMGIIDGSLHYESPGL